MPKRSAPSSIRDGGGSRSKTTIVAETVTGSHVLEVKGHSGTKGQLGVGKIIYSGAFSVAGHRWVLQYFPDGFTEESADHISLFVEIEDPVANADVKARFCFSLLNPAGEPVSEYTRRSEIRTFSCTNVSWGYKKFIERKELESSYLKDDDSFQIKCDLTVFKDVRTETETLAPPPSPELHRHLGSLLVSKVGGDVELEVDGGELFTAHRYVLAARSSVFMAELFGPMAAATTTTVPVHQVRVRDMEARVLRGMLYFIYTDSLPQIKASEKSAMAQHLLVAADRYDLQRLKVICEDMLRSSMDVSIVATTLVLAEQHDCQRLKDACFEFLKGPGNLKKVMATDGFQHLKSSCPSLLEELLAQVAP